jgi:hypothetical protein
MIVLRLPKKSLSGGHFTWGQLPPQGGRKGHKAGIKRPRTTVQGAPEGGGGATGPRGGRRKHAWWQDRGGANGFRKNLTALGPWPVAKGQRI